MLADPRAIEGDWLVAGEQDAGRGRQGRSWVSAPGNFYGSTIVALRPDDPPAQTLSLLSGLAVAEAVDVAVPGHDLLLKWPNDLLLSGRKVAGILLERSGDRVVVGVGINLATAPSLPDRDGASLEGAIPARAFAPLLAGSFARLLQLWRQSDTRLLGEAWLARAHPVGTTLTVHSSSSETVTGRFDGIEPDGALRLRRENGTIEVLRSGDVEL